LGLPRTLVRRPAAQAETSAGGPLQSAFSLLKALFTYRSIADL